MVYFLKSFTQNFTGHSYCGVITFLALFLNINMLPYSLNLHFTISKINGRKTLSIGHNTIIIICYYGFSGDTEYV